ncbi:hypothetical protein [Desulfococcus multivorans]|uniref:Uncharacterized protein n=1 Tax=Desulfococcus multivorans DSM 2059 TaxID=1121405 RepID=S7UJK8_DESML|nr:hypothetical protein [Desulfococcus multivorans]AOY60484.1 uncharacterized protein Dmul_37160 [Desulfococcus multivorans]AQV02578.1 hypothetical protein B2D07_18565 [Desulfococcus multivorans]EPR32503.1 hypothetical protein dsmv_0876 [Desulfococcus multivorans DSM 2059]SKA27725.1 hypothetical protein SAMN02745446_03723 [Desulfococcus multivorans DSM 2059]
MEGANVDWGLIGYAEDTPLEYHPGIVAWSYLENVKKFRRLDFGGGRVMLYDVANQEAYTKMPDDGSRDDELIMATAELLDIVYRDVSGETFVNIDCMKHIATFVDMPERLLLAMHRLWVDVLEMVINDEEE